MRFQFHRYAASQALRVVLPTLVGQVFGHAPDAFSLALHDASAAQGFESTHVRRHHLPWVAVGRGLTLRDGQMMVGAVHAINGQRGDVQVGHTHVGRAFHLHHGAGRVLLQFRLRWQRDVVRLAVRAIDDQITLVMQLVG